jgi:hypothetical protein
VTKTRFKRPYQRIWTDSEGRVRITEAKRQRPKEILHDERDILTKIRGTEVTDPNAYATRAADDRLSGITNDEAIIFPEDLEIGFFNRDED